MTIAEQIYREAQALPDELAREVLDFVLAPITLQRGSKRRHSSVARLAVPLERQGCIPTPERGNERDDLMIWTLQIKLLSGRWANKDWAATIALDASSTLDDLHHIIQQAVDFDNDHLYGFFVARTPWSRDRVRYDGSAYNGWSGEDDDDEDGERRRR